MWDSTQLGGTDFNDYNVLFYRYDDNSYKGDSNTQTFTWGDFRHLKTMQFIIPEKDQDQADNLYIKVDMPDDKRFRVFFQDHWWGERDYNSGEIVQFEGIANSGWRKNDDPLHITVYAIDDDGTKDVIQTDTIWTAWISFRHQWHANDPGHYCHLSQNAGGASSNFLYGFNSATSAFPGESKDCVIREPHYVCYDAGWNPATTGVQYMQFIGSLVDMAEDGQLINIHLDDGVDVDQSLTNKYATHTFTPSDGCDKVCQFLVGDHGDWQSAIDACTITDSETQFKAGMGRVRVSGYGRVNAEKVVGGQTRYGCGAHWDHDQDSCGGKPGTFTSQETICGCEFEVLAGSLHLAQDKPISDWPVDIYEIMVAYGAPIGDAAIMVNAQYFSVEGQPPYDNRAKLFDVKTVGSFVDAADGPNLFGTGSIIKCSYLHHADDTVKMSASKGEYYRNTVLHGNTGSVILLGNFGLSLIGNKVSDAIVDGLYVHYVWMWGDNTQGAGTYTGILGMQSCMNEDAEINYERNTVMNVYVPSLGDGGSGMKVNRAISMGLLDPGFTKYDGGFCTRIDNPNLWGATVNDLYLKYWNVYQEPDKSSLFFANRDEDHLSLRGTLKLNNIQFYDPAYATGKEEKIKESAVKIYHQGWNPPVYYMVCGTDTDTFNCMDENGAYWKQSNNCADSSGGTAGCQNLEWWWTDVDGRLQFPWDPK